MAGPVACTCSGVVAPVSWGSCRAPGWKFSNWPNPARCGPIRKGRIGQEGFIFEGGAPGAPVRTKATMPAFGLNPAGPGESRDAPLCLDTGPPDAASCDPALRTCHAVAWSNASGEFDDESTARLAECAATIAALQVALKQARKDVEAGRQLAATLAAERQQCAPDAAVRRLFTLSG